MAEWLDKFIGNIWTTQQAVQPDGRVFERARRAPGSRILIVRENEILLLKEKRSELKGKVDIRLPGGKVFDKNDEYRSFLKTDGDIVQRSRESITKEALEEVGYIVDPTKMEYLGVDVLGATCSWDLHYWVATEFEEHSDGPQFHETEVAEIQGSFWATFDEAKKLALDKDSFAESRSALVLLRYIERETN